MKLERTDYEGEDMNAGQSTRKKRMNAKWHYENISAERAVRVLANQRLLLEQAEEAKEETKRCRKLTTETGSGIMMNKGSEG